MKKSLMDHFIDNGAWYFFWWHLLWGLGFLGATVFFVVMGHRHWGMPLSLGIGYLLFSIPFYHMSKLE